jgi:ABC-2 type transport system ATP-binding protein
MDAIETDGLSKQYGKVLRVKDLDLHVPEGAVYGFLGPNGAGKSTTLKLILGLAKKTCGTIKVFGQEVNERNRLGILKSVGSLIESPACYGHLSGRENLCIFQTIRGLPEKEIQRVLQIVRLQDQKDKIVSQYSLGMKQRLGLANALLGNPRLLILDEPTNGLDPAGIQEMRELISSLPGQYGMTVLVSSHLLSEIDQMATNLGIINQGELIFQGRLEDLHQRSKGNLFIRTLNNDGASQVLNDLHVPFTRESDYLKLPEIKDETVLALLVSRLAESRVGVVRVEERQKSLEDIFLQLTGGAVSL